jgi:hypothetical protein
MILGMDLTVVDDDIVAEEDNLHVRNPQALERLLAELRAIGYEVDDCRQPEHCTLGPSAEEKVKRGMTLWFAQIANNRFGKCGNCGQLIDSRGIFCHGRKCEKCGAVTYWELVSGSMVLFAFKDGGQPGFPKLLNMKVKRWHTETGMLYLYREIIPGRAFCLAGVKAKKYLEDHKFEWSYATIGKRTYIAIYYPLDREKRDQSTIEMHETIGHVYNSRVVKLWKGVEYNDWEKMPVPDYISIYEDWHKK